MKKLLLATSLFASLASTGLTMSNTMNNQSSNLQQTIDPNEVWKDLRDQLAEYISIHEKMRDGLIPLFEAFTSIYEEGVFPYRHEGTQQEHEAAIEARITATSNLTGFLKTHESRLLSLLDLDANYFLPSMMRDIQAMKKFLGEVGSHISHFHDEVIKKSSTFNRESVDGFVYVTLARFAVQIEAIQAYNDAFILNSTQRLAELDGDLVETA